MRNARLTSTSPQIPTVRLTNPFPISCNRQRGRRMIILKMTSILISRYGKNPSRTHSAPYPESTSSRHCQVFLRGGRRLRFASSPIKYCHERLLILWGATRLRWVIWGLDHPRPSQINIRWRMGEEGGGRGGLFPRFI